LILTGFRVYSFVLTLSSISASMEDSCFITELI